MSCTFENLPGALSADFKRAKYKRIDIDSEITQELASKIVRSIEQFVQVCARSQQQQAAAGGGPPILFVFLNSRGGSLHGALRICDALRRAADYCIVATVIYSFAYSAAATIALCGSPGYRFVAENGIMMIHHAVLASSSPSPARWSMRQHVHRAQQAADAIILGAVRPGAATRRFLAERALHEADDWYLYAHDLLEYGLADHCDVPALVFHVEYTPRLVLRGQQTVPCSLATRFRNKNKQPHNPAAPHGRRLVVRFAADEQQ